MGSIFKPQNGFRESWKLFLSLGYFQWLRPGRKLVINLSAFEYFQLKILFGEGRIKFSISF